MGHLNSVSDPGEGNLSAENKKIQMPGGCQGGGGVLMLQIDRCNNIRYTPYCQSHTSLILKHLESCFSMSLISTSCCVTGGRGIYTIATKLLFCKPLEGCCAMSNGYAAFK